jgi:hypothetical protein
MLFSRWAWGLRGPAWTVALPSIGGGVRREVAVGRAGALSSQHGDRISGRGAVAIPVGGIQLNQEEALERHPSIAGSIRCGGGTEFHLSFVSSGEERA